MCNIVELHEIEYLVNFFFEVLHQFISRAWLSVYTCYPSMILADHFCYVGIVAVGYIIAQGKLHNQLGDIRTDPVTVILMIRTWAIYERKWGITLLLLAMFLVSSCDPSRRDKIKEA